MALEYEDAGTVGSEREAKDGAQRNKVDLRDLHIRNAGGQSTVQKTSEFKRRSVNRRSIGTPYRRAKGTPLQLRGLVDAGRVFRAAGGVGRA